MNKLIKLMMAMAFATFSSVAMAVPLATVGTIDDLLASDTLGSSGEATEEAWIETVLGFDVDYTQLDELISGGSEWESVVGGVAGDYAFNFGAGIEPAYYIVKVGGGSGTGTADTHFLFENNAILEWAFINIGEFGDSVSLTNIGVISHVGTTGGGTVPEPGIVSLLAIGLIGVAVARRRTGV